MKETETVLLFTFKITFILICTAPFLSLCLHSKLHSVFKWNTFTVHSRPFSPRLSPLIYFSYFQASNPWRIGRREIDVGEVKLLTPPTQSTAPYCTLQWGWLHCSRCWRCGPDNCSGLVWFYARSGVPLLDAVLRALSVGETHTEWCATSPHRPSLIWPGGDSTCLWHSPGKRWVY